MTSELDLRSLPRADHRDRIFETLDDLGADESVTLVADRAVGVLLHHYQIERGARLEWRTDRGDDETRTVTVRSGEPIGDDDLVEFDVREMPPQRRHEVLTDTFDFLDPGQGFVLVNDHDPKPLYHELRSTRGETFEWEYTSEDPSEWRVEVVKTDASESDSGGDDVAAKFDVREIDKRERHPTIHHRYGNVPEGATMEIVAPHEPRPLRREFVERYGDSFSWDVVENEPGRCRVQITKESGGADGASAEHDGSSAEDSLTVTSELDVRDLPPAQRHERIFDAYDELESGEAFVLVNDHDPKPLYHQFDAEAGPAFRWEYQQREQGEFRVRIGKAAGAEASDGEIGSGHGGCGHEHGSHGHGGHGHESHGHGGGANDRSGPTDAPF
ncbi:DUF2249 domain-containing protein [Halosimplex salinum]|uniref:DUF2249 domain-containing protein n=1 Tax=Halosimplex salinum TaxID=1710538 RepID=UPI000F4A030C|nr:DUF2249 domain-containing protein [Halosimplex salinum]